MCGVYAGGQRTTYISTFIRLGSVTHDAMANDFQ